jgi:DNA-binding response OmpR family regulator
VGKRRVLIIDNDHDIAALVRAALHDEGYEATVLTDLSAAAIADAVGAIEPDAVLLDGAGGGSTYGRSWEEAARLAKREPRVPVVMFTAHKADLAEARAGQTERSAAAEFAAILPKPFDLDELLAAVGQAISPGVEPTS